VRAAGHVRRYGRTNSANQPPEVAPPAEAPLKQMTVEETVSQLNQASGIVIRGLAT